MKTTIAQLVRENIKALIPYSSARAEYKGKSGLFLDANENPFGSYNRYPDPFQKKLKKKIAEMKSLRPEQVFLGNGSDGIVDLTYRIFCEPHQDKALIFPPTFGMYKVAAALNNIELLQLPLDDEFQMKIEDFKPYLADSRIKIVFICSPNNPTGNLMRQKDIEYILDNFKGIVVLDEAYIDFSEHESFSKRLDDYPRLVILQTMSKAWGLAGARMGMALMSEELLQYYNKVKTPYNVSSINQETALKALDEEERYRQNKAIILEEKEKMITAIKDLKLIKKIYPSDTNFLLVEVEDGNALYEQLIQQEIIVRNQNAVINNCMRITIGTPEENLRFLQVLTTLDHD